MCIVLLVALESMVAVGGHQGRMQHLCVYSRRIGGGVRLFHIFDCFPSCPVVVWTSPEQVSWRRFEGRGLRRQLARHTPLPGFACDYFQDPSDSHTINRYQLPVLVSDPMSVLLMLSCLSCLVFLSIAAWTESNAFAWSGLWWVWAAVLA